MNYTLQSEHSKMSSLVANQKPDDFKLLKTTSNAHKRLKNFNESFYYILHLRFPLQHNFSISYHFKVLNKFFFLSHL